MYEISSKIFFLTDLLFGVISVVLHSGKYGTYKEVKIKLHTLTVALEAGEWTAS